MGSFKKPALEPGPLKDLNEALHALHLRAGYPSTREISRLIERGTYGITASHERVRSAFSREAPPAWALVKALAGVLAPLAGSSESREVATLRDLWQRVHSAGSPTSTQGPFGVQGNGEPSKVGSEYPAFQLDIGQAVNQQLERMLTSTQEKPLIGPLDQVPDNPGVYQLFLDKEPVYFGTDDRSLQSCLGRHRKKISGRRNLAFKCVTYKVVTTDQSTALLMDRERYTHPWNRNGFGNSDPGRARDSAIIHDSHFDAIYPININWPIPSSISCPAMDIFTQLRGILPYRFRYQKLTDTIADHVEFKQGTPVSEILQELTNAPFRRWQITALPGYLIAYPERRRYPSAIATFARSKKSV